MNIRLIRSSMRLLDRSVYFHTKKDILPAYYFTVRNSSNQEQALAKLKQATRSMDILYTELRERYKTLQKLAFDAETSVYKYPDVLQFTRTELNHANERLLRFGIKSSSVKLLLMSARLSETDLHEHLYELGKAIERLVSEKAIYVEGTDAVNYIDIDVLKEKLMYAARRIEKRKSNDLKSSNDEYLKILQAKYKFPKKKIKFLMEKGYTSEEIWSVSKLLNCTHKKLVATYQFIKAQHLHGISLHKFYSYMVDTEVRQTKSAYYRNLLWKKTDIDWIKVRSQNPQHLINCLSEQEIVKVLENYEWFVNTGFHNDELMELIIVLGHEPLLLKDYWVKLAVEQNEMCDSLSSRTKKERVYLLNLLQYNIEKDINFRHPIAF